jgi:hypothetical protein
MGRAMMTDAPIDSPHSNGVTRGRQERLLSDGRVEGLNSFGQTLAIHGIRCHRGRREVGPSFSSARREKCERLGGQRRSLPISCKRLEAHGNNNWYRNLTM